MSSIKNVSFMPAAPALLPTTGFLRLPQIAGDKTCNPTDDFADLPEQMVQARRWLVWKSEPNPDQTKKPRKVPYYASGKPRSGQLDSPADTESLTTFDDALKALQTGQYAGLGFALGPDGTGNYWQGIDLDDLPSRPDLQHLTDNLPGYTEQSPSGKGVHAIGYGRPFAALGSNGTGIEAYSSGRFFTVTAAAAGFHPPSDLAAFVESQLRPAHSPRYTLGLMTADAERVETVEAKTVTELRSALLSMPADDRALWVSMGHALKPLGNVGCGLWLEWSATSDKFDAADAARTWRSFKPRNTGYQAVFAEAQRMGWVNPLSTAAAGRARSDISGAAGATTYPGRENVSGTKTELVLDLEACVVDLTVAINPDEVAPHVVEKLLPVGEVTLLAGHGGAGKSFIALLMAVHVALGKSIGKLQVLRSRVVFFSAEDNKAELQRRLSRICRILDIAPYDLVGWLVLLDMSELDPTLFSVDERSGKATATPTLDSLAMYVRENNIGLTIIDNASDTFDGNEVVRKQVRAFIRTLRKKLSSPKIGAVILLAHVSKAAAHNKKSTGASADEDYSGSTAWHNSVRSRLSLDTDDRGGSTLKHLKANMGPKADSLQLEWHDGAPTLAGTYEEPGAALFASMRKTAEQEQDGAYKNLIVSMICEFDRRGERIPTSMQGGYTVFKTLKDAPDFPSGLTSERLNRLIRELERDGRIFRTKKYTDGRKWRDSFTCSKSVVESAPNPAADQPSTQVERTGRAA